MASIRPSDSNQIVSSKGIFSPSQWSEACNTRYNWRDLGLPCIGQPLNPAQRITALVTGIFYTPLTGPATFLRIPKIGNSCAEGFFQAIYGKQCLEDPKPYLLSILSQPNLYPNLKGQIEGQPFDLRLGFIKGQYFNDVEIMSAGVKNHPAGDWLYYIGPTVAKSKQFALAIYDGNRRLNRFNSPEFVASAQGQRLLRDYPHYLNLFKYWRTSMDAHLLDDEQVVRSIWQHFEVLRDINKRASINTLDRRDIKLITKAIEFNRYALDSPHVGDLKANPQVRAIFQHIYPKESVNGKDQEESAPFATQLDSEIDKDNSIHSKPSPVDELEEAKASAQFSSANTPNLLATEASEQEDLLAVVEYVADSDLLDLNQSSN